MEQNEIKDKTIISASAVVNFLLQYQGTRGKMNNLYINKLAYFIHGFSLAVFNESVINEEYGECIEAWKFGPVIPSIYHEFKNFGDGVISNDAHSILSMEVSGVEGTKYYKPQLTERIKDLAASVITNILSDDNNRLMEVHELVHLSHHKNGPWDEVYKPGLRHIEIQEASIKKYFTWYKHILRERYNITI